MFHKKHLSLIYRNGLSLRALILQSFLSPLSQWLILQLANNLQPFLDILLWFPDLISHDITH